MVILLAEYEFGMIGKTFIWVGGWFVLVCLREMPLSAESFMVVWWKREAEFLFGAL